MLEKVRRMRSSIGGDWETIDNPDEYEDERTMTQNLEELQKAHSYRL